MVTLNMHDFIFVTLKSNRPKLDSYGQVIPGSENDPIVISWNSREYTLKPGMKTHVQLEAATNAFGDPRSGAAVQAIPVGDPSSGERLFIPDRPAEVRRLRARYGILDGNDETFNDVSGRRMVPTVTMETMNGEEIVSVLDDPAGDTVNISVATVTQAQDMDLTIQHMREQIEALTKIVNQKENANPNPTLDDLPSDVPDIQQPKDIQQPPSLDDLFGNDTGDPDDETFDTLPGDGT